jgi:hypothetical protein
MLPQHNFGRQKPMKTYLVYMDFRIYELTKFSKTSEKSLMFTWFGPPEHNTLCPRRESCIAVCVALFKAELNLKELAQS